MQKMDYQAGLGRPKGPLCRSSSATRMLVWVVPTLAVRIGIGTPEGPWMRRGSCASPCIGEAQLNHTKRQGRWICLLIRHRLTVPASRSPRGVDDSSVLCTVVGALQSIISR